MSDRSCCDERRQRAKESYAREADKGEPAEEEVLQLETEVVLLLVLYMWIAWFRYCSSKYDLWEPDEQSNWMAVVAGELDFASA